MSGRILWPALALLIAAVPTLSRTPAQTPVTGKQAGPVGILVTDGSPVHDIGNLRLHTTNWGMFGSMPAAGLPFSFAPSAEWPAGSGNEYLFAGGLWVGAMRNGIPSVSTAVYEMEFRPTQDPVDIVYRAAEGNPPGLRYPFAGADDDHDSKVDEDPLDGHDNDSDGKVDEDFGAISPQMLTCWYTDDQPSAQQIYPQHRPLHIMVREASYQWTLPDYDDFVGYDYEITNTGTDVLEDVYVGFFVDGDVGPRNVNNYWDDDATAFKRVPLVCTQYGSVSYDYAYFYDNARVPTTANGDFGIVILDHPVDATGQAAPKRVGVSTYKWFRGNAGPDEGGDPTNDFERYEAMSSASIQRDGTTPADYRVLVSVGPFEELLPGQSMTVSMALVATPRDGTFANVVNAVLTYKGIWFDADHDPTTGVDGRETPVPGPVENIVVDPCRPGYDEPINWPYREPIWINADCEAEMVCGGEGLDFRTGIDGRETQVHWWPPAQEVPLPAPLAAQAWITPRTINLRSMGDPLNARVTLPEGFHAADVREETLRLNETIPGRLVSIDSDRVFTARFSRKRIAEVAGPGDNEMRVGFMAGDQPFLATDQVRVIHGDGPVTTSGEAPRNQSLSLSPNPFNPSARIVFELPYAAEVTLAVYSATGTQVRTLVSGYYPAGRHDVVWQGRDDAGRAVASGIYFCRLVAGGETITKKMVMIK